MIQVQSFVFNEFGENTYLLYDDTKDTIIIDPGCYHPNEKEQLKDFVKQNNLNVVLLLNTHCHIDHVLGNKYIKDHYQIPLYINEIEAPYLKAVSTYAPNYGFINYQEAVADHYVDEGEKITFGDSELEILFVPGHSPGHLAFINKEQNFCIGGDVLFQQSIGRTDLPGGDHDQLIDSIKDKLFVQDDNMIVYPGHGPSTIIKDEKKYNPFLINI